MKVRRVIVAMGDQRSKLPINELLGLKTSGITIQEGADFYELTTGKLPIDALRLSWLVFSPGFRVSKIILIYKRAVSLLLAGLGLLFLSPLIALIALAIRLDSPGPVIFRQLRIGKGGQPFTLFKFRTMFVNADLGGYPKPAEHNDQRVTRVGRWLRRFRLDEIPQLYNILRGQMYFVGPRPFVPEQEMELAQQIPLYTQRWTVKPGATGWAQVQRGYCASLGDNTDKLAYDLFYIKNTSISLDLLILIKTIKIVFAGQGGR
jgi:exopolysaccharide biosynthesis polyprenyl glycosylphosphotransferase